MVEQYANKPIKLFSLTSNLPIAEKISEVSESHLERFLAVSSQMARL